MFKFLVNRKESGREEINNSNEIGSTSIQSFIKWVKNLSFLILWAAIWTASFLATSSTDANARSHSRSHTKSHSLRHKWKTTCTKWTPFFWGSDIQSSWCKSVHKSRSRSRRVKWRHTQRFRGDFPRIKYTSKGTTACWRTAYYFAKRYWAKVKNANAYNMFNINRWVKIGRVWAGVPSRISVSQVQNAMRRAWSNIGLIFSNASRKNRKYGHVAVVKWGMVYDAYYFGRPVSIAYYIAHRNWVKAFVALKK